MISNLLNNHNLIKENFNSEELGMKRYLFILCSFVFVSTISIYTQNAIENGNFETGDTQGWDIQFSNWGSGDKLATVSVFAADDNTPNTTQKLSLFNGTGQSIQFTLRQEVLLSPGEYVSSLSYEGGESGNNIRATLSVNNSEESFGRLSGWKFWKTAVLNDILITQRTSVLIEISGTLDEGVWLSLDDIELIEKSQYIAKDFSNTKPAVSTFGMVDLSTNTIIDTANFNNSYFFSDFKYWDAEVNFGVESTSFGALLALSVDGSGSKYNVSLRDTHAWVRIEDVAKITLGDFTTNGTYGLTEIIDVYDLGILQYKVFPTWSGINVLHGDELGNVQLDLYLGHITLGLSWLKPYTLSSASPQLNIGTRVVGKVHENITVNLTAVYDDSDTKTDKNSNIRIGTFASFDKIFDYYSVLFGYTVNMVEETNQTSFEHGVDLRAEAYLPFISLATQNNVSYYGAKELVLYNEIKAEYPFYEKLLGSLSLQSTYYSNGLDATKNVYNFNAYLDIDYKVSNWATLTTGVYLFGVGNTSGLYDVFGQGIRTDGIVIGIPLKILVEF